jgi:SMODS and SLOG-associating 2TM effector domain 3/SMODS and SLOG-associating 2TM effector domain 1
MTSENFPALYRAADESSTVAQKTYFRLIGLQYSLLVAAAVIALWFGQYSGLSIAYALVVAVSSALLIYMSVKKPEREWHGCRAFAESIKTSTWCYMMRAEPFEYAPKLSDVRRKFADFLQAILEANSHVRESIGRRPIVGDQITAAMDSVRALPLDGRKSQYRKERIADQRNWYIAKVIANRRQSRTWITLCAMTQFAAIVITLLRIRYDKTWSIWPVDPLLVLATSIIGWIQIKKFNELASAYNLTAHEIGIIATHLGDVSTEAEFSKFVKEAERVFSREHAQWVAHQAHKPPLQEH